MGNFPENPYIDRLVGVPKGTSAEDEKKLHEKFVQKVESHGAEKIKNLEVDKTEREKELIQIAEKAVSELMGKYDRKNNPISLGQFHVLKEGGTEELTKGKLANGAYSAILQSILVDRCASDVKFLTTVFHELVHYNSYVALQAKTGEEGAEPEFTNYRAGLAVVSRDNSKKYWENIMEGVMGHLTDQFFQTLETDGRFKDEIEKLKTSDKEFSKNREKEQDFLNEIIDAIVQKNPELDHESVLGKFIDAQIHGNIMGVARLIEKTFGPGSLKTIDVQIQEQKKDKLRSEIVTAIDKNANLPDQYSYASSDQDSGFDRTKPQWRTQSSPKTSGTSAGPAKKFSFRKALSGIKNKFWLNF